MAVFEMNGGSGGGSVEYIHVGVNHTTQLEENDIVISAGWTLGPYYPTSGTYNTLTNADRCAIFQITSTPSSISNSGLPIDIFRGCGVVTTS